MKRKARVGSEDEYSAAEEEQEEEEEEQSEEEEEEEEDDEEEQRLPAKKARRADLRQQQLDLQQGIKEASMLAKASELRARGLLTDLVIVTRDGQRHPAHRVVLATVLPAASLLHALAVTPRAPGVPSSSESDAVEVTCSGRMMEMMLDFIYEGRLVMSASSTAASATAASSSSGTSTMMTMMAMNVESSDGATSSSSPSSTSSSDAGLTETVMAGGEDKSRRGRIQVHADEVWELVHEAEAFGVPGLAQRVREEVEREMLEEGRVEKAVAYLYHLHVQEQRHAEARDLLKFVVDLMAHNFEHFAHNFYFNVLPFPLFRRIVHHPEIAVRKEVVVWEAVRKYCATVLPSPSSAEIADLASAVRFGYMMAEELRGAELSGLVSDELIKEGFFHSLQRKESPGKWRRQVKQIMKQPSTTLPPSSVRSLPRPKPGKIPKLSGSGPQAQLGDEKVLRYKKKDFGQDGIVWWLGTNRGKKNAVYQNPYDARIVGLTPSSVHGGYPLGAVFGGYVGVNVNGRLNRHQTEFYTNSLSGSWLIFDFGFKYRRLRIKPTHITIKSTSGGSHSLCNFDFQASRSGTATGKWKTLLSVKADMSLQSGGSKTWRITKKREDDDDSDEEEEEGYRYFRIVCTGTDTSGSEYLALSGFEIYGKVAMLQ